jgi:hypothetical protein
MTVCSTGKTEVHTAVTPNTTVELSLQTLRFFRAAHIDR